MAATESDNRIDLLSRSKRLPPEYKDDRRSVYWVGKEPLRGGPDNHTVIIASPRVIELSRHRTCVDNWKPHRPTPIWAVSEPAKSVSASARLSQLSEHKRPHQYYSFDRNSEWEIRKEALSATPSTRLEQLCLPKKREETYSSFDPYWGYRYPISEHALRARGTERLEYLANHKDYHKDFKNEKVVQWPVSKEALAAIASLRLQQLSRPRSRTMIKDDYDPYKVSPSAKKVRATPRLEELCAPIPRKVRPKKVV